MLFPNSIVFLVWISFGLCASLCIVAVLAVEYDRMLIFTEPLKDKALPGHVIRTEKMADEGGCRVKCYFEPNCVSINMGPADDGQRICELNNVTDESPSHSALEERHGYIYYGVENFCHGNPCPGNNFLCQVGFTNKGFRCVCKEGYSGERCNKECHKALGLESGAIADAEITASSQHDGNHAASQGRLNYKQTGSKSGSWAARTNDGNQWLQVDLGNQHTRVTRVATQGRNYNGQWSVSHSQWVTKYKLQYRIDDGVSFAYYKEQGKSAAKEFTGNTDRDSIVTHDLKQPIRARYIRFRPTAWHDHISMRVELYGCKECHKALGMESGAISDAKITASSRYDVNHASRQGRLNFQETGAKSGSWAAGTNDGNQWLQVDLGNQHTRVTCVATQGRNYFVGSPYLAHTQWVTKYKLQYSSDDGVNFAYYKEKGQTVAKEFTGNTNRDSIVTHVLKQPIRARYIRFLPTAWHGHISMRVEVYGFKAMTGACFANAVGVADDTVILDDQMRSSTYARFAFRHPYDGRLHLPGTSWCAQSAAGNQDWLKVDLGRTFEICGVATQGLDLSNPDGFIGWVVDFKIHYSLDGNGWAIY